MNIRLLSARMCGFSVWNGTPCTLSMCKVGDKTCRNEERSELGNNELPKYLFSDRELE